VKLLISVTSKYNENGKKMLRTVIEMKLKLFFKNEIIIEIIVKWEWNWK